MKYLVPPRASLLAETRYFSVKNFIRCYQFKLSTSLSVMKNVQLKHLLLQVFGLISSKKVQVMRKKDDILLVDFINKTRVSDIDQSCEDNLTHLFPMYPFSGSLKLRFIQREDPKYPLHALHIFFLKFPSPKAQWIHLREYPRQTIFNVC